MTTPTNTGRQRIAGCDLGKATASFVVASMAADGVLELEATEAIDHRGKPMDTFADWYQRAEIQACATLGATGLYATELGAPAIGGLPEDICLQAALRFQPDLAGPLNLISIGARGYSVLTRSEDGHVCYVENDKCSSGTGETMVKIAGRFGLTIEEADVLAGSTDEAIPITARCSVFAKSEMTHFGNQGRPAAALFRGYFRSVAIYVSALLSRVLVDGPVAVIGGGARITALTEALGDAIGQKVIVPTNHLTFEALGAAVLAHDQILAEELASMPTDPHGLVHPQAVRFETLAAPSKWAGYVTRMDAASSAAPDGTEAGTEAGTEVAAEAGTAAPAVLGLDLGSTGSKAVLTSIETGEAILDVYDRTRGNPVEASQRLIESVLAHADPDVRAIALTGSGREAAATVIRAVYPDLVDHIVVENEIVAHATAAIRCDDEGGENLSVVEIGGQDAKFISIKGGNVTESDMNKACSAGTGSFLEEQSIFYGIDDIEEFTRLAAQATRPPDLGQMCTVFVAEAAAQALNEGFELSDIFGGFQYSVIHNYINRVMGQRTFGKRIFFQGKPATGASLAWTLAAVTGRHVVVPPNPGAMGAWGIGLCTLERFDSDTLLNGDVFDLRRALGAKVIDRSEFQCRDKQCATLCTVERTKVRLGTQDQTVLSGGACPRYENSRTTRPKLPKDAPDAFGEREALLEPYLKDTPEHDRLDSHGTVGVPLVGACYGYLPWLVTFVRKLGFAVQVLRPNADSLARGEARCYSFDACAPVKTAHGVIDADVETVFFPKLLTLGDRDGCSGRTCPMEQALPEMVREALHAKGRTIDIVHPVLSLEGGLWRGDLLCDLFGVARGLGATELSPKQVASAARAAATAQQRYETALAQIGQRTIEYGHSQGVPVVLTCGPLHVITDPVISAGIPNLIRNNGVLALPMDCLPIPDSTHRLPRIPWAEAKRTLRSSIAAREYGGVYPLLLSSFGCGPASFTEHIFAALMDGYPHTALESDGHGGTAGYTTRVQAFLHTVQRHDGKPAPTPQERLRLLEEPSEQPITREKSSRFVVFSIGDRASPVVAAGYRAHGVDAVASGPTNSEALRLGRTDCSGKECLPYQLMWGSFRQYLENGDGNGDGDDGHSVLIQVAGEGMCRNCMFPIKDKLSIEALGLAERVGVRDFRAERDLGWSFAPRVSMGLVTWDILYQLAAYYRPSQTTPGQVDRLYSSFCDELEDAIASPARRGVTAVVEVLGLRRVLGDIASRASDAFARLALEAPDDASRRTVLLTGDIYVRIDEFASDNLIRRLNDHGLRVIVEPSQLFLEYLTHERERELVAFPRRDRWRGSLAAGGISWIRRAFYDDVRPQHPWLPVPDLAALLAYSQQLLDRYPKGEAPVTVGSVMHHWHQRLCDGVVVVSPWGCGPALISESLLRHQREIPMLFVYVDGSPIDERRLNAFTFRLRRERPRIEPELATALAPA